MKPLRIFLLIALAFCAIPAQAQLSLTLPVSVPAIQGSNYYNGDTGGGSPNGGGIVYIAGGIAPYTCTLASGSLPTSMVLAESTPAVTPAGLCILTGTPTVAGDYSFTVTVTDSTPVTPLTANQAVSFVVITSSPPVISAIVATPTAATSETITWTTDVNASSYVCYGGTGTQQINTCSVEQDTGGVTSHSVIIPVWSTYSYGYQVVSRGISGGVPKDYLIAASADYGTTNFTAGSPPSGGGHDYGLFGAGPHNAVQGFPLVVQVYVWTISGTTGMGTAVYQVTGIPSFTQVHWPDVQDLSCSCGSVATTTTTNDTYNSNGTPSDVSTQFEILSNVGGTTPVGNYTLTFSLTTAGGPTRTIPWAYNVTSPSFPSGSPSSQPAIPLLSTWQANMNTYGIKWQGTGQAGCTQCINFYDGTWVYQQMGLYGKNLTYWKPIADTVTPFYRDSYVIAAPGSVAGFQVFPRGLYRDCTVNVVAASCTALTDLAQLAVGHGLIANSSAFADSNYTREGCYQLDAKRLDYDAGGTSTLVQVKLAAAYCLGDLDQIVNGQNWEQAFINGLAAHALISYYDDTNTGNGDSRVPPTIKALADWMWTNEWLPWQGTNGNFVYAYQPFHLNLTTAADVSYTSNLWELNLLIAPIYAWLYKHTGLVQYQLEGDEIWYAGNNGNVVNGVNFTGKNFSQQYLWSIDYVTNRSNPSGSVAIGHIP